MLYHKIDTVFKRDPDTKHKTLLEGEYSNPAFEYLAGNRWMFTEKVDGTNIRVTISPTAQGDTVMTPPAELTFGGRTEEAQIPAKLVKRLQERFLPQQDRFSAMFPYGATLFGEGYGTGIQAVGKHYGQFQDFVLFDVRVRSEDGTLWWLERANMMEVADALGLRAVPIIGYGTLTEMVEMTRAGFQSLWADEPMIAEGIVARPTAELCDRGGRRIITKIKHKDFVRK